MVYSVADCITNYFSVNDFPFTSEICLFWFKLHYLMILIVALAGMGPLGTTNSLAPPKVRPKPANPEFARLIGEANPAGGV